MKSTFRLAAVALLLTIVFAAPGQLRAAAIQEDFNDGLAAGRWSIVSQQEVRPGGPLPPDGSVDFAFDYSTLGIANPDGGSDTIGAFLQFNKTDQAGDEGESYSIYPNGFSFTGGISLSVDMYVYNDGGSGSTEHGMAGLFLDNANPVSPYEFGAAGGPLAWVYSGEGGDGSGDLGSYAEGDGSNNGYAGLGDYSAQPVLPPGFTTSLGPGGSGGGSWVDVEIRSDGTTVKYVLNGVTMASYDNSGGFYTSGNVLVGGMDVFNSSNANNGVIVDNVTVIIPEPSTALLVMGLLATASLAHRRRG